MEENKKELIDKLYLTANLVEEIYVTKEKIEKLKNEDAQINRSLISNANSKVETIISTNENKIASRPVLPKQWLIAPPKKPRDPDCDTGKKVMMAGVYGFLVYVAFIFLGAFMILASTNPDYIVPYKVFPVFLVFIGLMLPWVFTGARRADVLDYDKKCQAYEQSLQEWANQLNEAINEDVREAFLKESITFDNSFLKFINQTHTEINDAYSEYHRKKQEAQLEYVRKNNELVEHKKEVQEELASVGVLTPSYYYLALHVADNLKSGRADTLKEALNLAIDDERKENEAEARRNEAQRQEEILRRQAEEERRHNREMERAAREQNDELRRQGDELKRQADQMRQQSNKRYDTSMCSRCYNYGRGCNGSFVRQTGTCGSFRSMR
ncbi:MAG: hypothetical protein IJ400_05765 [Clostridia bacterium]|nr:hypothetical protein [Clostridia bacterium]